MGQIPGPPDPQVDSLVFNSVIVKTCSVLHMLVVHKNTVFPKNVSGVL